MALTYYIPTQIIFGAGSLEQLGEQALPGKKALIVTTAGKSMQKYGYLERVEALLSKQGVEWVVFNKVLPNPIKEHVMEGAALAIVNGCDFVIGLGGGSSIDSAKSIAVMATNPGDYWDYVGGGTGKALPLIAPPLAIVAITTTAGTGTEADPWTVITKEETAEKIGFGNNKTFPTLSIVDPELMVTVPPTLTAYQGFDALFHAMEGYIATSANVFSDMYALKAIELLAKHLPEAVHDGENIEARTQVALANTLAGMVESTSSCTSEHSLEHALSAYHPELPHGAGLIMLSLAYFEFFSDKVPERFVEMAKALGMDQATEPMDCVQALAELENVCGVGNLKMSDYGIEMDHPEKYAMNAMETMGGLFMMDRYKMDLDDAVGILQQSFK